ncbi:MAG: hypothetical protein JSS04_09345 [Proteobacteria bacterium]|nr:hypothetical protein [Pseudomonadota bacterium]
MVGPLLKRIAVIVGIAFAGALTLLNWANNILGAVQIAADPKAKLSEMQQAVAFILSVPWYYPAGCMVALTIWLMYITLPGAIPVAVPTGATSATPSVEPTTAAPDPNGLVTLPAVHDYFPAEKSRLSELLTAISEEVNNKGLQIVRAPWLRTVQIDRNGAQLDQFTSEIDATRKAVEELAKQIWTHTILENQKYEKELIGIVGGLGGDHPLSNLEGRLNNYRNEIERYRREQLPDGARQWIAEFIFNRELQGNVRPAAEAVGRWIHECNAKIGQQREILR